MPTRLLRDGILDSGAINALSIRGELFYRRLMSLVDDYGRTDGRVEVLRAKLFALQLDRWSIKDVREALNECQETMSGGTPLVVVYEVSDRSYIQINNFGQRVRAASKYPSPPASTCPPTAAECGQPPPNVAVGSNCQHQSEAETKAEFKAKTESPPTPPVESWGIWPDAEAARDEILSVYPKGASKRGAAIAWWQNFIVEDPNAAAIAQRMLAAAVYVRDHCPVDKRVFLPNAWDFLSGDWQRDWGSEWQTGGRMAEAFRAIEAAGRTA